MSATSFCGTCSCAIEIGADRFFHHVCRHGDDGHRDHVVLFSISAAQREERFPRETASA